MKHSSRSIFSDFINSRKDYERACHLSKEWVWTLEGKPVLGPTGDTQSTLYKMQHSSFLPLWKTQILGLRLMFHILDWCFFTNWCQIGGGWLVPLWCGSTQSTEFKQALFFLSIWRGDTGSYKRNPKCADNFSFSELFNWLSQLWLAAVTKSKLESPHKTFLALYTMNISLRTDVQTFILWWDLENVYFAFCIFVYLAFWHHLVWKSIHCTSVWYCRGSIICHQSIPFIPLRGRRI